MKWFQPIECKKTVKRPLICDYGNFEQYGFDENTFKVCNKINNWNENITLEVKQKKYDGFPDDVLQNAFMIPVFSARLTNEISRANINGIQYLPIKVFNFSNEWIGGFSIANILNSIAAFDYERSNYSRFAEDFPNPNVRGKIAGVMKFVLKGEALNRYDIVRLDEYNLGIFVSEKFKEVFENNKFTGYAFKEIDLI